jgi:diaminopimelate decarboxylase
MDPLLAQRGGHQCFDGVDLVELASGRATPFFVFSERRLRENVRELTRAFRARHAATELYYASKANSNLWVLNVVREAGAGLEVNAGGEIEKALLAGFSGDQLVFNGVAKTRPEIARALGVGVRAIVVDSLFELERVAEVAAEQGVRAPVIIRVDVHVPTLTHPGLETAYGGKPGIDRDQAAEAFILAATHPHLDPLGLHLHIGSQITSVEPYRQAIAAGLDLLEEMEAAAGLTLRVFDAGGGFAVWYRDTPESCQAEDYFCSLLTFDDYAEVIAGLVAERRPDLTVYLEPGRSIPGDAAVLVSRIENEKVKVARGPDGERRGEDRWVTVDAGYNTLLEHTNYHWYYRAAVAGRAGEPADTPFRLAGPLCDGGDVFTGDEDTPYRLFPAGTTVGDLVVFFDVGAYTLEMMMPYNARPRAGACAVTTSGEVVEIRRRETDADLVAHDVAPRLSRTPAPAAGAAGAGAAG